MLKVENIIKSYEERAKTVGISIYRLLKDSGVSSGGYYQWRKGKGNPTLDCLNRLHEALERHEKAKEGRNVAE